MSPENQPRDPRIAPKEMIVTRRKSAQQKRQLRDKDRSMKSITQLLKSPTRSSPSPKKAKVSPKKSPRKKLLQPAKQEPPQPQPRRKKEERTWLKPRHNFTMVARTNKRKLCTPHREIDPLDIQCPVSPVSPEPDMAQLIDDVDSLDDEDFMEILTCPSPVWWEDPPDPCYTEKAICTRSPSLSAQDSESKTENITEHVSTKELMKTNVKKDSKFMNKRNKLENILGSIKNKKHIQNDEDDKSDVDGELVNDELLNSLENMDIPIEPEFNKRDIKTEKTDIKKLAKNIPVKPELNKNAVKTENIAVKEHANEIKIAKQDLINEVNLLLNENRTDVPIKVPENLPPLQRNPMHSKLQKQNVKRSNRKRKSEVLGNNQIMQGSSSNTSTKSDLARRNLANKLSTILDQNQRAIEQIINEQTNNEMSQSKSTCKESNEMQRNAINFSPESVKSESKDLDTISDTNIKFIDRVEDKELDDTSQIILDKIKKFFQEKEKKRRQREHEYITVYKIVDNEEKCEIKNDDQSKINYFYKKCKNIRKKDTKDVNEYANNNKTLSLPNSQVKYCFRCSSIFETQDCHYCAMSEERECDCDKSQDSRSDLSCDNCDKGGHVSCKK